jgi:hypothetical protein
MARVNILLFVNQLANVVMDFVAQDLSTSGLVMSAFFFVVILALICLNLVVVYINLDLYVNRPRLHDLTYACYVLGLAHVFF